MYSFPADPMRPLLLVALLVLSGCATYSVPPRSDLTAEATVTRNYVGGKDLTVVLDADLFTIDDASAVRAHVGKGDPAEVMREFIATLLPQAILDETPLREVDVVERSEISTTRPEPGETVTVGEETPTFVLYVDGLHQYRAKYSNGDMFNPGTGTTQAVRNDVDYRLWDNQTKQKIASGRVESEETIPLIPNRRNYEGAVEEMAEKLSQRLGIRARE